MTKFVNNPANPRLNVDSFRNDSIANPRYASFDHCFNYFREHWETGQTARLASKSGMQLSCLHLGYYLASWGMFRGKAALLQHNSRALLPAVEMIANATPVMWTTDVVDYDENRIEAILKFKDTLKKVVPGGHSDTLTSKIMLGVFGCVPAFDTNFRKGFHVSSFSPSALIKVHDYYNKHKEIIEGCRAYTIGFDGKPTKRRYTQAKVIDMIFFIEGAK
jgi:hypothetical protein